MTYQHRCHESGAAGGYSGLSADATLNAGGNGSRRRAEEGLKKIAKH